MLTLLAVLLTSLVHAEEPDNRVHFEPIAQYRPRLEVHSGRDGDAATGPYAMNTHRARLGVAFDAGQVGGQVVFQDVQAWTGEEGTGREALTNGVEVSLMHLDWAPVDGFLLRVGRQEVALHDERLITRAWWRQTGRHFDGARLAYRLDGWGADALALTPSPHGVRDGLTAWPAEALYVVHAGHESEDWTAEAVGIYDTDSALERQRATVGAFTRWQVGDVGLRAEAYGQLGRWQGDPVQAWMAAAEAHWRLGVAGRPELGLALDVLSGDARPGSGVVRAFDTVQGANHRYYGTLDVAYFDRGGPGDGAGLVDAVARMAVQPSEAWRVEVDHHWLSRLVGPARTIGYELDVEARWQAHSLLTLIAGGALLAPPARTGHAVDGFAYLSIDLLLDGEPHAHPVRQRRRGPRGSGPRHPRLGRADTTATPEPRG